MKQRIIAAILLVLTLSMSACSVRQMEEETPETTQQTEETTTTGHSPKYITEEEALAAAKAYLGEKDPEVGYSYSFVSQGTMEDTETGESFYKVRVSWYLPEDDRYSVCGYLLVSRDGKNVTKFDW